jgi:alanine racemase
VAPALERAGVDAFGVATAAEALALRAAGVTRPVLLFAPVRERIAELCEAGRPVDRRRCVSLAAIEAARRRVPRGST